MAAAVRGQRRGTVGGWQVMLMVMAQARHVALHGDRLRGVVSMRWAAGRRPGHCSGGRGGR